VISGSFIILEGTQLILNKQISKTRRLFLGIQVPLGVSRHLIGQLLEVPGRIVPPQNWHLTLHFLGAVEDEKLPLIHTSLQSILLGDPFLLTFDHLGAFPNSKRAHSLWIGVGEEAEEVQRVVQLTGDALELLGFEIDQRPHVPHLTVRRFSLPLNIAKLIETLSLKKETMKVDHLVLYESILNQGSPRYVKLYAYDLGKPLSPP